MLSLCKDDKMEKTAEMYWYNYAKKEYEYILTDAKLISLMKRNRYLHVYFKRAVVSLRLKTSYK